MTKIRSYSDDTIEDIYKTDKHSWKECADELWDRCHVLFLGVHAIKILWRDDGAPLFALGSEDDGTIRFNKHRHQKGIYAYRTKFDSSWSNDLIELIKLAQKKIREIPRE